MEWYDIIDFPIYQIFNNAEIVNKRTGKKITGQKQAGRRCLQVYLYDKDGKVRTKSEAKLLYCAVKGISPLQTGRYFRFFFTGEEKTFDSIKVVEPFEQACHMHTMATQYKIPKEQYYKESIEFADAVLWNNWNKISEIIDRHKRQILKLLSKYTIDEMRMEAIYAKIKADLIIGVESGAMLCGHPFPFLRKYIVILWKKRKREKYLNINNKAKYNFIKTEDGLWDMI